jgi:hypothetical protein
MEKILVNHDNFDQIYSEVEKGNLTFYVVTYLKAIKIDNKCINKFKIAGYEVIKKSNNGNFKIMQGKNYVTVLKGYLFAA